MTQENSLAHMKWMCKYHIVWIPKYPKKKLFGNLRRELGPVLRELARQRESEIEEGQMLSDHVHILISIPPKYSVAQVVGYIKGKSAIHIAALTWGDTATSPANTSGPEATMSRRLAWMKALSGSTFRTRKQKFSGWNSSTCCKMRCEALR